MAAQQTTPHPDTHHDIPRLTAREIEVVTMTVDGLSSYQIGNRLSISARTVDNHLSRVRARLREHGHDVPNRPALVAFALDHGLVTRPASRTVAPPPTATLAGTPVAPGGLRTVVAGMTMPARTSPAARTDPPRTEPPRTEPPLTQPAMLMPPAVLAAALDAELDAELDPTHHDLPRTADLVRASPRAPVHDPDDDDPDGANDLDDTPPRRRTLAPVLTATAVLVAVLVLVVGYAVRGAPEGTAAGTVAPIITTTPAATRAPDRAPDPPARTGTRTDRTGKGSKGTGAGTADMDGMVTGGDATATDQESSADESAVYAHLHDVARRAAQEARTAP